MSIGRLRRNLDLDLIARMAAHGGRIPRDDGPTLKRQAAPRAAGTYRAARRNAARPLPLRLRRLASMLAERGLELVP